MRGGTRCPSEKVSTVAQRAYSFAGRVVTEEVA